MPSDLTFLLFLASLVLLWSFNRFELFPRYIPCESKILANVPDRFVGLDNSVEPARHAALLVPNVVHFVRVGEGSEEVSAEEAACISAALRTQPGSRAVVHTDRAELRGVAWRRLLAQEGSRIHVQRRPQSLHVFGLAYRDQAAMHRVVAIRILMKHGGMYVPNNVYLREDVTPYRRLECATASTPSSDPGVVLAHRDARLLREWLHLHHDADLDWPGRPPHGPHLCRDMGSATSLLPTENPVEKVNPDDWYLFARTME